MGLAGLLEGLYLGLRLYMAAQKTMGQYEGSLQGQAKQEQGWKHPRAHGWAM